MLIGGLGVDQLFGGSDDDILTGGTTNFDDYDLALKALLADLEQQLAADAHLASDVTRLRTGQTAGNFALNINTVAADGAIDQLRGESANDWLLAPLADNDQLFGVIADSDMCGPV